MMVGNIVCTLAANPGLTLPIALISGILVTVPLPNPKSMSVTQSGLPRSVLNAVVALGSPLRLPRNTMYRSYGRRAGGSGAGAVSSSLANTNPIMLHAGALSFRGIPPVPPSKQYNESVPAGTDGG